MFLASVNQRMPRAFLSNNSSLFDSYNLAFAIIEVYASDTGNHRFASSKTRSHYHRTYQSLLSLFWPDFSLTLDRQFSSLVRLIPQSFSTFLTLAAILERNMMLFTDSSM